MGPCPRMPPFTAESRGSLFADVSSGRSAAPLKNDYIREHGIPARMFNAVRVSLEGKVSGARESQLRHVETLKGLVRRSGKELAGAGKRDDRRRVWSGCASAGRSCGAGSIT